MRNHTETCHQLAKEITGCPKTQDPAYKQALRDALAAIQADRNAPVSPLLDSAVSSKP